MQGVTIVDTSCLILLEKIGELGLLNRFLGEITITQDIKVEFERPLPDWFTIQAPIN